MTARQATPLAQQPARLEGTPLRYWSLERIRASGHGDPARLPMTIKLILEGLLREVAAGRLDEKHLAALSRWPERPKASVDIPFMPARILMQDFTGVPAIVDLAAMRDAIRRAGKDPARVNPVIPVDLVVDHSVQVDVFGMRAAYDRNLEREYQRNGERYALFKWAQGAFDQLNIVPPGMGICHQVNLERLSRVVQMRDGVAIPDTLLGTDSHTTMVNGLGVLGWGVGGIEAEAALLGQPMYLPWPEVLGVKFSGRLPTGTTATDLVLTMTELFRKRGVVNKFIEFCGAGLSTLSVADRATLSNMTPEYGATASLFPVDAQTLRYLETTGREPDLIALVERYAKAQGLFRTDASATPVFDDLIEVDLGKIESSLAGPKRPQDRTALSRVWDSFVAGSGKQPSPIQVARFDSEGGAADESNQRVATAAPPAPKVEDGSVVIAAITSCTNTSNPSVMVAAGLLAKKAVERGLETRPTVKTSLAPGSRVVTDYLDAAGLTPYLEQLGFFLVGYGCTTCIGQSGPLSDPSVETAVTDRDLNVVAVLSGNRNFEGRIHPLVRSSYLASPPLVVAFALAGTVRIDLTKEPIARGKDGTAVYLKDLWPSPEEVEAVIRTAVRREMFEKEYAHISEGDERWRAMPAPKGALYQWDPSSTYVKEPPFFQGVSTVPSLPDVVAARALLVLGDSVTTDHISPAGSIAAASPAGRWLIDHDVVPLEFNSYGTRRGNHEVLVRGTFANIRLRNRLVPEKEGWWTKHLPDGEVMAIYDAAMRYRDERVPLVVLAGKEYGSGSSRDWAAKGPQLLGIRAVIAESFERIHRSNLVGMGIVPLEFEKGGSAASLGLSGEESFTIRGLETLRPRQVLTVEAVAADGKRTSFTATAMVSNDTELEYLRNGGILTLVLRQMIARN